MRIPHRHVAEEHLGHLAFAGDGETTGDHATLSHMHAAERGHRRRSAGAALASLSDAALMELLARAEGGASSIGGSSVRLDVAGVPVFAKCVPVTELEMAAQNRGSTANLFDLPTMYHYGVGSTGTNVWRELAAHEVVTTWVVAEQVAGFPLLYHARLLPVRTSAAADEGLADTESVISYWDGSVAVGRRVDALASSTSSLALFLEYIPTTLATWLSQQSDVRELEAACHVVERQLLRTIGFMNAHGLHHFDVHLNNVLTDGRQLYLTDFGLTSSVGFELTQTERDFLAANATHDKCLARTMLMNWVVTELLAPQDAAQRNEIIRTLAAGERPSGLPSGLSAMARRHAAVAVVINDFYWSLFGESRATPYPTEAAEQVLRQSELQIADHGYDG